MKVDDNALKGQFGEAYVASRLSSECLVRQTTSLDVGIDLYCETVQEDQPFLHFWCQVKTGVGTGKGRLQYDKESDTASYRFKRKHLDYWERQSVPVFAALVPTEWPVQKEPNVYIIDITTQRLMKRHGCTLKSDYKWAAGDKQAIRAFLQHTIPETTARILIRRGVIGAVPQLYSSYVVEVPETSEVLKYQTNIRTQIRRTAAWSVIYLFRDGKLAKAEPKFIRRMKQVLEAMPAGWDSCYARGLISHHKANFEDAAEWYQKSLTNIETDADFQELLGEVRLREVRNLVETALDAASRSQFL